MYICKGYTTVSWLAQYQYVVIKPTKILQLHKYSWSFTSKARVKMGYLMAIFHGRENPSSSAYTLLWFRSGVHLLHFMFVPWASLSLVPVYAFLFPPLLSPILPPSLSPSLFFLVILLLSPFSFVSFFFSLSLPFLHSLFLSFAFVALICLINFSCLLITGWVWEDQWIRQDVVKVKILPYISPP